MSRPVLIALLCGAAVLHGGCTSPPPPESSLPGALAVEARGSGELVEADSSGVDVPPAAAPGEGQNRPAAPDPNDGAGTLLIYTAITGQPPFGASAARSAPTDSRRWTAEGEASRGRSLEAQIQEELQRQQAALAGIESGVASCEKVGSNTFAS